jgi:hypothetical protein
VWCGGVVWWCGYGFARAILSFIRAVWFTLASQEHLHYLLHQAAAMERCVSGPTHLRSNTPENTNERHKRHKHTFLALHLLHQAAAVERCVSGPTHTASAVEPALPRSPPVNVTLTPPARGQLINPVPAASHADTVCIS